MIDQLIGIIGREAAVFESFLNLLEQQKRMLVANDLAGLQAVTEKQREKLVESRMLNLRREQLVAQIKDANGFGEDVTVSRLLTVLDEGRATQLRTLRETIQGLNAKITQALQPGKYYLRIRHYRPRSTGKYTVSVRAGT